MWSESQVTLKAHLKRVGMNRKWDHWDGHSAYRCLREMCVFHSVNLVLLNLSTSPYQQAQSGNVKNVLPHIFQLRSQSTYLAGESQAKSPM